MLFDKIIANIVTFVKRQFNFLMITDPRNIFRAVDLPVLLQLGLEGTMREIHPTELIMKPYDQLTRLGKLRRMRSLAVKALAEYDLRPQWIKFLADDTNISFKIRSFEGENYVLRIYSNEETTLAENQAEVFWLQALKRDTDLKFTEPVLRVGGEAITIAGVPGIPGEKRCILFTWVPGRVLENSLNPQNYFKLGVTMAKLHDHAESLKPLPAGP